MKKVSNVHITSSETLPSPRTLRNELPKSEEQRNFVAQSREAIHRIIFGDDERLLVVVGPCSIHDLKAGREYGERLRALADEVKDSMLLVMRVYFEKPRTTVGWKGLIMDPKLDGTHDLATGLRTARKFLQEIIDLGLPTATELLDPITPQYIADLVSWAAIGARTTESQTHRQMASGLSMPLGFKNNTEGNIKPAINAIKAASKQQTFLGINLDGEAAAITTSGNENCHIILRGGEAGPNYSEKDVSATAKGLKENGLKPAVMVDCSHENSGKVPAKSIEVFENVIDQAIADTAVIGLMLESNLSEGNQAFPQPISELKYGVSITDPCINWEDTERIIRAAHQKFQNRK